jgi:hypothetical protein
MMLVFHILSKFKKTNKVTVVDKVQKFETVHDPNLKTLSRLDKI